MANYSHSHDVISGSGLVTVMPKSNTSTNHYGIIDRMAVVVRRAKKLLLCVYQKIATICRQIKGVKKHRLNKQMSINGKDDDAAVAATTTTRKRVPREYRTYNENYWKSWIGVFVPTTRTAVVTTWRKVTRRR